MIDEIPVYDLHLIGAKTFICVVNSKNEIVQNPVIQWLSLGEEKGYKRLNELNNNRNEIRQ